MVVQGELKIRASNAEYFCLSQRLLALVNELLLNRPGGLKAV